MNTAANKINSFLSQTSLDKLNRYLSLTDFHIPLPGYVHPAHSKEWNLFRFSTLSSKIGIQRSQTERPKKK